MTEFLDVYDANRNHAGVADRNVVHAFGLWHKTVHCWLVLLADGAPPKMLFQRRSRKLNSNAGKLYTTASGHVAAGESIKDAFAREIGQEIGLNLNNISPKFLYENVWAADMKRDDGTVSKDRAFANIYYAVYNGSLTDFKFTDGEVDGIVAVDLIDFIKFAHGESADVMGTEFDGAEITERTLTVVDFLLTEGETILGKYGRIADMMQSDLN